VHHVEAALDHLLGREHFMKESLRANTEALARHGRGFVPIDENLDAPEIMAQRLGKYAPECSGFTLARRRSSRAAGRRQAAP
jgi:hypothetical protein